MDEATKLARGDGSWKLLNADDLFIDSRIKGKND